MDGRLRRYYRLNDAGATALAVQAQRLHRRASVAERLLDGRAGLAGGAA